jgi:hypothetical protein
VDKDHAQAALGYFNQADNRTDYSAEEQTKILAKIVQAALAAGIQVHWQPGDAVYRALPAELQAQCVGYVKETTEAEKLADAAGKLGVAEKALVEAAGKLSAAERRLGVAEQTIIQLNKQLPGGGLLKAEPLMFVSEHVAVLEKLLPPLMVERSSMGLQQQGQLVRAAIFKAKEKLKAN